MKLKTLKIRFQNYFIFYYLSIISHKSGVTRDNKFVVKDRKDAIADL